MDRDAKAKSDFGAYVSTINYTLGAGVLGIPAAFVRAGLGTGVLLLSGISVLSAAAMVWEVEAIARCEWLLGQRPGRGEASALLDSSVVVDMDGRPWKPRYRITPGRLDMIGVSAYFLGASGRIAYSVAQVFYTIVTMWFYIVVVAVSVTGTLRLPAFDRDGRTSTDCDLGGGLGQAPPECQAAYRTWVTAYVVLMMLSMINEAVIRRMQLALAAFASCCILTMVVTALVALVRWSRDAENAGEPLTDAPVGMDPAGFGLAFSAFVFAQLAHHGVPTLLEYMDRPTSARAVFASALATTGAAYAVLGVVCGVFFGTSTNEVVTLNWKSYTAETPHGTAVSDAVSLLVRLFPVVTVSAAFPLNAVALGAALERRLPAGMTDKVPGRYRTLMCRYLVCVPSVVGAALMNSVSALITLAGLAGFVLAFLIPAALQAVSRREVRRRWAALRAERSALLAPEEPESGAEEEQRHLRRNPQGGALWTPRRGEPDGRAAAGGLPAAARPPDPSWTPYSWHFSSAPYAYFSIVFAVVAMPYTLSVAFFRT